MTAETFAGNIIATGRVGGGETWSPGRPHDWTGTEVVAVVTRDGSWHAYLIDDVQRDDFESWVRDCGEWCDPNGKFDAVVTFESADNWQA